MADATIDEKLRDMAEHRGLKLVKSRKRKAGVGDFGKFGLTDPAGKPLLGISAQGLEASAEDIEAYLRAGAVSTWKASAETTPDTPASKFPPSPDDTGADQDAEPTIRPRGKRRSAGQSKRANEPASTGRHKQDDLRKERRQPAAKEPADAAPTPRESVRHPNPTPAPEPKLIIRSAKSADAAALVPLLRQLSGVKLDELGVARNLKTALKADAGMAVAELGEIAGCCAWAVIPTIQHGLVGRLTLLLVAEAHRRKGIATALLDAAIVPLRKAGCARLEAMSDIEVKNAHNFFRTLKFEQTSYRFARTIELE
jgi:ribosomal protein S18 acetylase RimI-like enzyme